jgi:site-specific DNA-methyltransferase (adenine-specific)
MGPLDGITLHDAPPDSSLPLVGSSRCDDRVPEERSAQRTDPTTETAKERSAQRTDPTSDSAPTKLNLYFEAQGVWLYQNNCLEVLDAIFARYPEGRFDMIFADPPYFLSNGGITCHAGKMVSVHKGDWDQSRGWEWNHEFNTEWLRRCQRVLKPNGTLWVTGTHHVIFSVGFALQQLGFKILNDIAWEKPNPPPNLSCRYFTHSTETILWAAKNEKSKHVFNYQDMRKVTGKQMKTVWTMTSPKNGEKAFGKHPTQKPVALVERCILASTKEGDLVLDPFLGGGTTAVAAVATHRKCVGIELDEAHISLAKKRVMKAAELAVNRN